MTALTVRLRVSETGRGEWERRVAAGECIVK